ncbi:MULTISPECIES: cytochrome c oxidase subunit II [unclassified Rhodococcus (in: high G+C Gram-positive bacteria)]|uniref:aa3-type cytochrome oxidase subunit II n=1 Tax=unclassified Rhodococcus (in: high G+C Gram-positive bacteria) TaxID=192944 RepID=UPI0016396060|nr:MULTISPECIES: cytochrome c oxidase subunit II [unclassified Rhodococcus (in: high G+C Gram-positive bacteria)]MBC2638595.1 cytochrome c oxidase subunit II [Rhodococcus sp. 3A]MBC2896665.1 cytochrome c oxidase subunit II [Rhodococcus sp. 4CII]
MNVAQGRILRRAGLAVSLGIAALLLSGCSIDNEVLRFGWPSGVTPQAHRMRELWTWSVIAALVMGVLVWGLTFWAVIFHRKKKDSPEFPRQTAYNVPLELAYTAVPFVIIAVLFYFTVIVQNHVLEKEDNPNVVVDVTAYQWNWKFGYRSIDLGEGGGMYDGVDQEAQAAVASAPASEGEHALPGPIHGKTPQDLSYLHYDKIETVGSSNEIPILVLPTGKRIQFELASADVIHAFWVPEFLFKRDVNPNPKENHSDNVFQISEIEKEGAFVGRCAEMCGTFHAMMNFEVRAVSPDKFAQYIELRKPASEGGRDLTTAEALQAIGESPVATSTSPFTTDRGYKQASGVEGN